MQDFVTWQNIVIATLRDARRSSSFGTQRLEQLDVDLRQWNFVEDFYCDF